MFNSAVSLETFLSDYWQKKTFHFKQAFPSFTDPLSPEELAGLACEEEVESRLVRHKNGSWLLQNGPFNENEFTALPQTDWTLLVQAVDVWFTELQSLYSHFSFIPSWRFDDIMVSYATDQGGVGPHFDYYDVFIIQGMGKRRWQLGQSCDESTALKHKSELKILEHFSLQDEFLLETGDMLYIPPGLSHYGVSLGPSLSYSIGFRAPSYAELIEELCTNLSERLSEQQRYQDNTLAVPQDTGEIRVSTIDNVQQIIKGLTQDRLTVLFSFAKTMTRRKYPEQQYLPEQMLSPDELPTDIESMMLEKHPAARFAFSALDKNLYLFADGTGFQLDAANDDLQALVRQLCEHQFTELALAEVLHSKSQLALICSLYNQGSLISVD
jgi:50S ribosomal protein L16 3-hydroxylase